MLKVLRSFKKLARTISTPPKMAVELQMLRRGKDLLLHPNGQDEQEEDPLKEDVSQKPEDGEAAVLRTPAAPAELGRDTLGEQSPQAEPPAIVLADGAEFGALAEAEGTGGEDPEFELWVETELEASWCLEDNSVSASHDEPWREACQTSMVRRRWDEFEALPGSPTGSRRRSSAGLPASPAVAAPGEPALGPAQIAAANLRVLGLPEDADEAQVRAAFRRRSLECHPDKGGSADDFQSVVKAYQSLASSW